MGWPLSEANPHKTILVNIRGSSLLIWLNMCQTNKQYPLTEEEGHAHPFMLLVNTMYIRSGAETKK